MDNTVSKSPTHLPPLSLSGGGQGEDGRPENFWRGDREVRIYPDMESLSQGAAEEISHIIKAAVQDRDYFTIALSGGSTPAALYRLLADNYSNKIQWPKVHIFWGDERCVPAGHADSNFAMAHRLLISRVPIAPQNIHSVPAEYGSPEKTAEAYEQVIRDFFLQRGMSFPCFDMILLGIGEDGHTASLFPGDSVLREKQRLAAPVLAPADYSPRNRITLTLPVINNAENVFFIVSGKKKGKMVAAVLDDAEAAGKLYPAAMVRPKGRIIWFLDDKAYAAHKIN